MQQARLAAITRNPVKGLAGQEVEAAALSAGGPLPHDRRFALVYIMTGSGQPAEDWSQNTQFVGLVYEERLAALGLDYDAQSCTVTLLRDGKQVTRGKADTAIGRTLLTQFFTAYLKNSPRGAPKFVEAPQQAFSTFDEIYLHLISRQSLLDLERVARQPVDARRFRANLIIEELPAWQEFDWIGKRLRIGGAIFEVVDKTQRCAATTVNPDTAQRDLNIPRTLRAGFGHLDMGVYLRVVEAGRIAAGDEVEVLA